MQSDTKFNKKNLSEIVIFLCIIVGSVFILKLMGMSLKAEQNKHIQGIVYLISISGRVQISDFQGMPYVENGHYTWYDKKGSKHWTKAPLMFVEKGKDNK